LPLQDIETFRVAIASTDIETRDEIFHLNQTDLNRHVNTIVYLDIAQDRVCDLAHRRDLDVGSLRFRELDVFYRKPFTAGHPYRLTISLARTNGAFEASVEFAHLADGQAERTAVAVRLAGTGG
jgi:acyl-ACP thioesterase